VAVNAAISRKQGRWWSCQLCLIISLGLASLKGWRGRGEFARDEAHINCIEGFWGYAKSRMAKFRSMSIRIFYLHLKECEFRFNHRHE